MGANTNKAMAKALERMLVTLEGKVDPSHAALIVIDVQNDFCAEGGVFDREGCDIKRLQAMIPHLINLIDRAREVGLTIIFVRNVYSSEDNRFLSDVWLEQANRAAKGRYIEYSLCEKGSWNWDFYDGIKPLPGEIVVTKHRYNAFADTDLDLILRSKGIRTLIMSGVTTDICVDTTARAGFVKDYYIVFLRDCTAAYFEETHNNTLKIIANCFGEVVDSSDVIKCWEKTKK